MNITLNGLTQKVIVANLSELLKQSAFKPPYAVAVNHQFIPKQNYETTLLASGDRVDVVSPIQGG